MVLQRVDVKKNYTLCLTKALKEVVEYLNISAYGNVVCFKRFTCTYEVFFVIILKLEKFLDGLYALENY